jgi:hypothetical protein
MDKFSAKNTWIILENRRSNGGEALKPGNIRTDVHKNTSLSSKNEYKFRYQTDKKSYTGAKSALSSPSLFSGQ